MSIRNDIRLEALARKRGPPIGPRVKHHFIRDEEGTLVTIYPGLACAAPGCSVLELTSKNRYGKTTLCMEHGREEQRNRVRKPRAPRSTSRATTMVGSATTMVGSVHAPNYPGLQTLPSMLHEALKEWLQAPGRFTRTSTSEPRCRTTN